AEPPTRPVRQAAFIIGRRGGKDQAVSVLASYLAGCCEWPMLVRGETGVVMIIAADTEQADEQLGRIEAAFEKSPILREQIVGRTRDTLKLVHKDDDGRVVSEIEV